VTKIYVYASVNGKQTGLFLRKKKVTGHKNHKEVRNTFHPYNWNMKFLGRTCIAIANRKHGWSSISRSKSVSSSSANFRLSHSTEIIRDPTASSSPCSNKDHQPSPFCREDIFIKVHIGFMPFQKGSNTPSIGMHIFTSFVVVENGRKDLPKRITRC
jgi:hypothetical protein